MDIKKTVLDYTKKKIKNAMSNPEENGKSDKAKHADTIIRNPITDPTKSISIESYTRPE